MSKIARLLNERPRKNLDFRTPYGDSLNCVRNYRVPWIKTAGRGKKQTRDIGVWRKSKRPCRPCFECQTLFATTLLLNVDKSVARASLSPLSALQWSNMKKRSIAAFILFLYDCVRLGIVLGLTRDNAGIPLVAANALFPVASFFLFAGPQRYREYGPLYIAGKVFGVFAGLVWLFFALKTGLRFPLSPFIKTNSTAFLLIILIFADTLSLLVRLSIHKVLSKQEALPPIQPVRPDEPFEPIKPFESTGDIA
jgi:hypothetical protein